ncbi:histone H1-delta-like [Penaeus japonicus]|uniref:histone H1-delta-like n=1 Tax=Penaeus japonicus TaxID=27405 RepID=UPI001C70CD2D|nr:histone H1-delta-like [Penaeus japonicus]
MAAEAPAKKAKKPTPKPTHPKYSVMIAAALNSLKERNGSSRQAILKYILANYKVGETTTGVRLKLALRKGVAEGSLKQIKGTGAAGSFKLAKAEPAAATGAPKKRGRPAGKKNVAAKKPGRPAGKKPAAKKPSGKKPGRPAGKKNAKKPGRPAKK